MNLLDVIKGAQNGAVVSQLGQKFGLGESDVTKVIGQFLPALTNGMKKNISQGGLSDLMSALQTGRHDRYLERPEELTQEQAVTDGDGILGHLFDNDKNISRDLARRTSESTGIDSGILKKMLPMVAGLVMGAMRKQTDNHGLSQLSNNSSPSALAPLMKLLDADGDGSVIDELLGLAQRFMR